MHAWQHMYIYTTHKHMYNIQMNKTHVNPHNINIYTQHKIHTHTTYKHTRKLNGSTEQVTGGGRTLECKVCSYSHVWHLHWRLTYQTHTMGLRIENPCQWVCNHIHCPAISYCTQGWRGSQGYQLTGAIQHVMLNNGETAVTVKHTSAME